MQPEHALFCLEVSAFSLTSPFDVLYILLASFRTVCPYATLKGLTFRGQVKESVERCRKQNGQTTLSAAKHKICSVIRAGIDQRSLKVNLEDPVVSWSRLEAAGTSALIAT